MASRGAMKGVSLIKRGWHEIPEIMCCLGMIGLSTALLGLGVARYDADTNHQYKFHYTVVRDTEVKPEWVKKNVYN
ncbi:NADH dehydrogenase [ubiquinone] 1 alpha subcomplex subunit 3-like [Babylonia areolata]|uniref:NADH dehydrogenase [ubiquinone] 1 alpha subcomplex subunit 3-like n=1 Tax=Babylonia areolata TaxID=304850 RepID=UPI003FD51CED